MNKKIAKLGEKTNLTKEDVKRITKIGISGLLALTVAGLTGLGSDAAAQETNAREMPAKCRHFPQKADCKESATTYYYDPILKFCIQSTGCVSPVYDTKSACNLECVQEQAKCTVGGRPYTCGTRYFTVSPGDFAIYV